MFKRFLPPAKQLAFTFLLTLTASFAANANTHADNISIIHAGKLLAIPGEAVKSKQTVVVKNGKIAAIHSGYKSAADLKLKSPATIINQQDGFVMPGLIDLHTHITNERDVTRNRHEWTTLYDEDFAFEAIPFLKANLDAGFTTVRNLGSNYKLMAAIKRAINKGLIEGPEIVAAMRPVTPTGGHGQRHGYHTDLEKAFEPSIGVCDGADDCMRAVRSLVRNGADVIKITATGGVLSNTNAGVGQQLTDDEMRAIVKTAHGLGRKVAAHAHAADGINAALRAGVDSIEHGSYLNEESVKLFKQSGAYLVPTLLAGVSVHEDLSKSDTVPQAIVDKINMVLPAVKDAFALALKNDVNIAFGTDTGVSVHGTNAREFELMVEYGMDNATALKSATVSAATLLGKQNTIGTLEVGKQADIIAIKGNPLKDIKTMHNVVMVIKKGKLVK